MLNEIITVAAGVLIAGILARGHADHFAPLVNLHELGALACESAWNKAFENFFTCKKFSSFQKCAFKEKGFRRLRTATQELFEKSSWTSKTFKHNSIGKKWCVAARANRALSSVACGSLLSCAKLCVRFKVLLPTFLPQRKVRFI